MDIDGKVDGDGRGAGAGAVEGLRRRGHEVVVADGWSQGRLSAVGVQASTGFLTGAANPRGAQLYAVGR